MTLMTRDCPICGQYEVCQECGTKINISSGEDACCGLDLAPVKQAEVLLLPAPKKPVDYHAA